MPEPYEDPEERHPLEFIFGGLANQNPIYEAQKEFADKIGDEIETQVLMEFWQQIGDNTETYWAAMGATTALTTSLLFVRKKSNGLPTNVRCRIMKCLSDLLLKDIAIMEGLEQIKTRMEFEQKQKD